MEALKWIIFSCLTIITISGAVVVAFSKHIVRSAFALLFAFGGIAGLFAFLGADFLAVAQLVIYIGGIAVLLIFAVMLTHKIKNVWLSNELVPKGPGLLITLTVYIFLNIFVITNKTFENARPLTDNKPLLKIIGKNFVTDNLFLFEITSFVLLVALIAALYIGRAKKLDEK
ncbi:MAG: NADH-quinone oxidoreductase subunit J [Planctomycetota bacterium]